jgi:hypothetical protein
LVHGAVSRYNSKSAERGLGGGREGGGIGELGELSLCHPKVAPLTRLALTVFENGGSEILQHGAFG